MTFLLSEIAGILGFRDPVPPVAVAGWSVDTRNLARGDLFFALKGPNFDGHNYVREAFEKGAVGAVVDHVPPDTVGPLIVAGETQRALETCGSWARRKWGGKVVAVTGSAGKTSSKEIIAAMLATKLRTGKNAGNLNNHVGVPLSILRLPEECEAAVLEMGMNHAGEIAALTEIAAPEIGVVTNVGHAHIENFESIEGIAAAKRELIDKLPEGGIAVLNADDPRVRTFGGNRRTVTFGIREDADIRASRVELGEEGLRFEACGVSFESRLSGRHAVSNLLAGIAVASLHGIAAGELREAVKGIEPGNMRGRRILRDGILHINDCYNSNPDAVRAMLEVLAGTPAKRRIAVLGEMLELGRWSESLHREIGAFAAKSGIEVLVGIRGAARHAVQAAIDAGLPADAAYFFDEPAEAGDLIRSMAKEGDAILWKGSRGTRVELALERVLG